MFSSAFTKAVVLCCALLITSAQRARASRQLVGPGNEYCPPGFQKLQHGRHCYRQFTTLSRWTEAWTLCRSINTDLLTIDNAAENQAITDWISAKSFPDKHIWLAGNSLLGHWSWAQQGYGGWQPLPYSSWGSGQPSTPSGSYDGSFQCLLSEGGQWQTASCDQSHAFVCKYEIDGLVSPDGMVAG